VKLPTPDCPWCSRRVEDRGDHFACPCRVTTLAFPIRAPLPEPVEWYLAEAAAFGRNSIAMMPLANYAYREARWAARAAMRAVPELRP